MRIRLYYNPGDALWVGLRWRVANNSWYDLGIVAIDYYPKERTWQVYFWRVNISLQWRG